MSTERPQLRWAAFLVLAAILLALGCLFVPAHWTSIWMDQEFTDWVTPISNRLDGLAHLYEAGLHSPMPPLPFILVRLLYPHGAVWLDENRLNFIFQSATVLLLFWAFSKQFDVGVAFVCALAVIPVFLTLQKTILYDSMVQFLVAATGITVTSFVQAGVNARRRRPRWVWLGSLGLLLALALLTKQSTAMGTVLGTCFVLAFLPRSTGFLERCANVVLTILFLGLFFCLITLALTHFLNFYGLIHDVFLTGAEPKGGTTRTLKCLLSFGETVAIITATWGGIFLIVSLCLQWWFPALGPVSILNRFIPGDRDGAPTALSSPQLMLIALVSAGLGVLGARLLAGLKDGPAYLSYLSQDEMALLNVGLVLSFFLVFCVACRRLAPHDRDWGGSPLATYAVVFLASALFHNLSVNIFRWTYDNNPLIFLAVTFPILACVGASGHGNLPASLRHPWLRAGFVAVCFAVTWPALNQPLQTIAQCRQEWPEIHQLAGARLRPESAGMRDLVATVRSFANPANNDTVLLLPNDPNVEAWFERRRVTLSCAIIFTDQYWDGYVDQDFARLQTHPPKVIVIGPRYLWRPFSRMWNVDRGAERLIDLVRNRLLPVDYDLRAQQPIFISHFNSKDFMDVYVRRGTGN